MDDLVNPEVMRTGYTCAARTNVQGSRQFDEIDTHSIGTAKKDRHLKANSRGIAGVNRRFQTVTGGGIIQFEV